ncbi:MAG: hypothetical protein A2283_05705 [Lentisphaerae bacterium RIFOXYA12_FULL_48_11]|nr:MAG: hypothetical protein A2283_05705 [Lentisphaerae bacterium RIFOXYA12_FULL_48_11]
MRPESKYPRICLLTNSFHPVIGGGETHALLLCREWLKRGASVFVMTRRITSDLKREENTDGLTIRRLSPSGFRQFGKYLMIIPTYLELLQRRNEYDVIYVCGLRTAGLPATMAALRLGKTCILRSESRGEFSGDFIWNSPDPAIRKTSLKPLIRVYLKWRNKILMKAAGFISISRDIQNEFNNAGIPTSKNNLIYNGIDTGSFEPAENDLRKKRRKEFNLPLDKKLFAYSGKLNKGKGLEMLLRVWKKLAGERKDCHLVLIGGGGEQFLSCEQELRDFASREELQESVTFAGFQTEMNKYLQAVDFFVFPSESEALSIALLEAQSCGLPCLVSDITGNRDIIENNVNGRLIPVKDEPAWLEIMKNALNSPDSYNVLGQKARANVIQRFSIATVADKHLALFRSLDSATGNRTT